MRGASPPPGGPERPEDPGDPDPWGEWAGRVADAARAHAEGNPTGEAGHRCVEWCPICRAADVLRATAPPELRDGWHDLQRELLLACRAVLDHHLGRLEERETKRRVEDIPID